MATDKYNKSGLMRKNKGALLTLASGIEFVTDKNTKSEIADAILIMQHPSFLANEGPRTSLGHTSIPGGGKMAKWEPGIDDPNYPKSLRVQRIADSQKES